MSRRWPLAVLLTILSFPVQVSAAPAAPIVTEFATQGYPRAITAGADGNLWFTQYFGNQIARITTSGQITEFPIPTADSFPGGIVSHPDGDLWFTESSGNKIGRITTAGQVTEYALPTGGAAPWGITVGGDGNLWFAELVANQIGRITSSGVVTEFPVPTSESYPTSVTLGRDGNVWFTEEFGHNIGRITPQGVVTEFPVPFTNGNHQGIDTGPHGGLWFSEQVACSYAIGAMNMHGATQDFPIADCSQPEAVLWIGDNLWFTTVINDGVWHGKPFVGWTRISTPTVDSDPLGLTLGPDGNVWFTEYSGNKIGRIEP